MAKAKKLLTGRETSLLVLASTRERSTTSNETFGIRAGSKRVLYAGVKHNAAASAWNTVLSTQFFALSKLLYERAFLVISADAGLREISTKTNVDLKLTGSPFDDC